VCQHVGAECSWASAVSPICLAAPRATRRAMRRTDFCLLTFFVSVPAPRWLSMRHALARMRYRGHRLPHVSAIRFGGPHVCRGAAAMGVLVPLRRVRSGPLTSLSPLSCEACRSRDLRTHESRQDCPQPGRVNDRVGRAIRDAFHRARTFAPQRPLERPALDFPGAVAWPPRHRISTPFHPRGFLADPSRARPPSTCPAANGRHASLSLGFACRFLQPETTREHTLRAFDPRTRVGLSPRYSPAPTDAGCVGPRYVAASGACEPRPANAGSSHDEFHLRG